MRKIMKHKKNKILHWQTVEKKETTRHIFQWLMFSSSAVEQVTVNHLVVGSIPTWTATEIEKRNWQDFIPQFRFLGQHQSEWILMKDAALDKDPQSIILTRVCMRKPSRPSGLLPAAKSHSRFAWIARVRRKKWSGRDRLLIHCGKGRKV